MAHARPLAGTHIAITRPVGTGTGLAARVRALGGTPLLLPGSSLRAPADANVAREALRSAMACHIVIFTSTSSVRFAKRLLALNGRARVLAPGAGTLRALRRAGCANAQAPAREDSEGLLALPLLKSVRGKRLGIVGAADGRELLDRELARRGATIVHAHVYQRLPAQLDRRHAAALRIARRRSLYVLLSSAQALTNILDGLPDDARRRLLENVAVVSSGRLAAASRAAGFKHVLRAGSAHTADLLDAVVADRG